MQLKHRKSLTKTILRKTSVVIPLAVLLVLFFISMLAPFLAGDKPIYVNYKNKNYFPLFSDVDYLQSQSENDHTVERIYFDELKTLKDDEVTIVMPLVPFAPNKSDMDNAGYKGPFEQQARNINGKNESLTGSKRHLLGTGKRGDDVLSGLIHGTKISLTVGLFSMVIAGMIGLLMGSFAGFFGDDKLKISRGRTVFLFAGLIPSWFFGFQLRSYVLSDALSDSPFSFALQFAISLIIFSCLLTCFIYSGRILHAFSYFKTLIAFPLDSVISRIIEIIISMPRIILIITIAAIARPSIINLVLIIGLTSWTEIARLTRAEMLKLKSLEFIEAARSIGLSERRILFRHAFPNAIAPAMVALAFGIASAILTESALSFLGIGVPQDTVTWGSLLAAGRENFQAWWLVVFPGLAIFITVISFNMIGEGLRDVFDPRLKT